MAAVIVPLVCVNRFVHESSMYLQPLDTSCMEVNSKLT